MLRLTTTRRGIRLAIATTLLIAFGSIQAADLDPKAIKISLPKDIKWVSSPSGSEQAILTGDPAKPGLYIVLTKWLPHKNSRPHSHPNDRFITVLKGTWWVNTGSNYDPDGMKPVPAGSFVVHYGGQVHYDGAKDEECILQIVGMGPANSPSAERK
jgi:quercetin dioxygenase-like cupin family protein